MGSAISNGIENHTPQVVAPIGVFDSGYGGLTILKHFREQLPEYDFLYLGDNARAPYGAHSFETIYEYTRQGVAYLFAQGCQLVILACNTASARALRTIQQIDLVQSIDPTRRVLGIIRPTVEYLPQISKSGHVGLFATQATVSSNSYGLEAAHLAPNILLTQHATPMWAFMVEHGEIDDNPGVHYFIEREVKAILSKDPKIDALLLACTHYPLLMPRIKEVLPTGIEVIEQGGIVAESLKDYLRRHPEIDTRLSKKGMTHFLTTENDERFQSMASLFLQYRIENQEVEHIQLKEVKSL